MSKPVTIDRPASARGWGLRGTAAATIGARLSFENVSLFFGDIEAVCDVSFDLEPGEIVCLLGPSGCGKSTLLRLAAGVERPQAGRVLLDRFEPWLQIERERHGAELVTHVAALLAVLGALASSACSGPQRATDTVVYASGADLESELQLSFEGAASGVETAGGAPEGAPPAGLGARQLHSLEELPGLSGDERPVRADVVVVAGPEEVVQHRGDPVLEPLFSQERATYGDLLNPTKVMAHCPPILRAAKMLSASIAQSGTLPKGLAALVSLRVAAINGCPF